MNKENNIFILMREIFSKKENMISLVEQTKKKSITSIMRLKEYNYIFSSLDKFTLKFYEVFIHEQLYNKVRISISVDAYYVDNQLK